MVYLGAIRGLEQKANPGRPGALFDHRIHPSDRQLKGISGASAGAITAYMLALGMTADEIEKETNAAYAYRIGLEPKREETVYINAFERFFEPVAKNMPQPIIDQFRHVKKDRAGDDYNNNDTVTNCKRLLVWSLAESLITSLLNPLFGIDVNLLDQGYFLVQKVLGDDESRVVRKELDLDRKLIVEFGVLAKMFFTGV